MFAIGVDSGTQGTKALVVAFDGGKVLGRGFAPHRFVDGLRTGESEQDPRVWVEALEAALTLGLKDAGINPRDVVSLGISGQQHGFVPLDKEGQPIRPAKLWNDTSTVEETEALIQALGGKQAYIEKLGISLAVGYTASKILWLKRKEPENYRRLATVLLPHNYLNFYLTGIPHMEYGDASGTGLMDVRNLGWHKEAVGTVGAELEGMLPRLSHPLKPVGTIKEKLASRFGMGKVLVSSGGGDNMMGAVGSGNVSPGVCTVSLGTSGTIYSYFSEAFIDPGGEIAAFCDSTGGWLPLLCTMNVTNTTEYFKAFLNLSNEELESIASKSPAGAGELVFLPFIDGERVPVLPFARGVLFGLNRTNFNASFLARSVMEGTILNLGYGFSRMRSLGLKPAEVRATGGGAKSPLWLQIVADVFKTPVVTLKEQEAAAFGAALQSIWCYLNETGKKTGITEVTRERVKKDRLAAEPNPENLRLYETLQQRFNSLWKTLIPEFRQQEKMELLG